MHLWRGPCWGIHPHQICTTLYNIHKSPFGVHRLKRSKRIEWNSRSYIEALRKHAKTISATVGKKKKRKVFPRYGEKLEYIVRLRLATKPPTQRLTNADVRFPIALCVHINNSMYMRCMARRIRSSVNVFPSFKRNRMYATCVYVYRWGIVTSRRGIDMCSATLDLQRRCEHFVTLSYTYIYATLLAKLATRMICSNDARINLFTRARSTLHRRYVL